LDFVTALNVTIYGLGIVFLALLVIMFIIMVLSRLFAAATGKDFLAASTEAGEGESDAVSQPVGAVNDAVPVSSLAPVVRPVPTTATAPAPVPSAPVSQPVASGGKVTAPLPGKVISIAVKAGDSVRKGQELCVIEAMKMSNSLKSQRDCSIKDVLVSAGDSVPFGTPLFVIE
jgi:glutaconyl-CoA decarboxylase